MCHQAVLHFLFLSFSFPSFLSLPFPSLSLPFPHSLFLLCMFSFCFILLHSDPLTKLPYNLGGDRILLGLWGLPRVNKEPLLVWCAILC